MILEIFVTVIGVLAILKSLVMLRKKKITVALSVFWILLWLLAIVAVDVPQVNSVVLSLLGRDVSLLLFLNIIFLYYISLWLYLKINKNKEEITKLVREIALKEKK
ncbi:hypothetical protein DRJ22_05195 [Candidatus Woesearchaeota archaeon]|nr:MAG: hypothetical protein DRJ22_05195 [Candidatus Woesearchaeota archaeon]